MTRRSVVELALLLCAMALALFSRTYVVGIYQIPSDSMLPRVFTGDALLVTKWRFAWRHALPQRGDIVIFDGPAGRDYVKRVIGLPGDRVALRDGVVLLNGQALTQVHVADLALPIAPNSRCHADPYATPRPGQLCVYTRNRESQADGRNYDVIDLGDTVRDDYGPVTIPAGRLFVLGDNRDLSADSRVLPSDGGVGLVATDKVVGRAVSVLFSVDGSATWDAPESWWKAIRWRRIGVRV